MRRKRFLQLAATALAVAVTAWLAVGYWAAARVCQRHPSVIPSRPTIAGHHVEEVRFQTADHIDIGAWWIPNGSDRAVVILAGIRGNRAHNVRRSALYLQRGYSVLLPDLRAHGDSGGDTVSFGWHESLDVAAACAFLRQRGIRHIGAHGISLGAAAIVYGMRRGPTYRFVVLESCYDDIENAYQHRMERYPVPSAALWPMRRFVEWRVGATPEQMIPAEHIVWCTAPALIMAGDAEQQLPPAETQRLFDACGSNEKRLHLFAGAGHTDLERHAAAEYSQVLAAFLDRYL